MATADAPAHELRRVECVSVFESLRAEPETVAPAVAQAALAHDQLRLIKLVKTSAVVNRSSRRFVKRSPGRCLGSPSPRPGPRTGKT